MGKSSKILVNLLIILGAVLCMGSFLDDCAGESKIKVQATPSDREKDVSVFAIVEAVITSEGPLTERSLGKRKFSLEIAPEKKTETKTAQPDTEKKEEQKENPGDNAVNSIDFVMDKPKVENLPAEQTEAGPVKRTRTTLRFIPKPKDSNTYTPLEPETDYVFRIGELTDDTGNIFRGDEFKFRTQKKKDMDPDFSTTNVAATLKAPRVIGIESLISTDQPIIIETDRRVNPHAIRNTTFTAQCSMSFPKDEPSDAETSESDALKVIDQKLERLEQIETEIEKLQDEIQTIERSSAVDPQQNESAINIRIQKISRLELEQKKLITEVEQYDRVGTALAKKYPTRASGGREFPTRSNSQANNNAQSGKSSNEIPENFYCTETDKKVSFAIYYLEKFDKPSNQRDATPNDEDKKYKEMAYNLIAIVPDTPLAQNTIYELVIKATEGTGGTPIFAVSDIAVKGSGPNAASQKDDSYGQRKAVNKSSFGKSSQSQREKENHPDLLGYTLVNFFDSGS